MKTNVNDQEEMTRETYTTFQRFLNFIRKRRPKIEKPPLIAKDPNDNTLTDSSTPWKNEPYCPQCKSVTTHREQMAGICNSCGYFGKLILLRDRVSRSIWNGNKWVTQKKYNNSPNGYEIIE